MVRISIITFASITLLHRCNVLGLEQQPETAFLWSSTGGGWRAMAADMGFANLFYQAGLINNEASSFSAISTTSGGSWFSTQFFFSKEFHYNTLSAPKQLHSFVLSWMSSYYGFSTSVPSNSHCMNISTANSPTGSEGSVKERIKQEVLEQMCDMLVYTRGNWAEFITDMLNATSTGYQDVGFVDRPAVSENRVSSLQGTDLLIQTSLAPSARTRLSFQEENVMLGPSISQSDQLYSTLLPARYTVSSSSSGFTLGSGVQLNAYTIKSPGNFSFADYIEFSLYPDRNNGTLLFDYPAPELRGAMSVPFGGNPAATSKLAAISSAAVGVFSGLVPSVFAQVASLVLHENQAEASEIYSDQLFDGLSVCSQWPESCGVTDGRFVDGGFTDNPALAMNIANFQKSGNLSATLKVVLTNTNIWSDASYSTSMILSYFNTTFNQGVHPGAYIWAPEQVAPWPSSQIFDTYLDATMLNDSMQPISNGSNVTTALLNGTTLNNPMYGVQAGQKVEILLISINSNVPTIIVGPTIIALNAEKVANLALSIASSEVLLDRIQQFFGQGTDVMKSSSNSSSEATAPAVGLIHQRLRRRTI